MARLAEAAHRIWHDDLVRASSPQLPARASRGSRGFTARRRRVLVVAMLLLTASFLFVWSAQNGLTSTIGQQHAMSGQVSAAWNVFLAVPTVASLLIGVS